MKAKEDCFGYKTSSFCSALNKMYCKTEECSFYKTNEQHRSDMKKYGNGENYAEVYRKKHEG